MAIFKQKPNFINMADVLESTSKILDGPFIETKQSSKSKNIKTTLENKLKEELKNPSNSKKKPKVKVETYLGSDIKWIN